MKVGFVGLGNMGFGMARNLINAGHMLTVYNRTRSRAEELGPSGVRIAASPADAATGVEALITMLADDQALESVLFEPGNALRALPADAVHISMSTISVELSRKLAAAHEEKGQQYLAAPVLGRPEAATAAKLFVIAAGPNSQIDRCQSLFDAMGQRTFRFGEDAPAANVVKLSVNFLLTTVIEGLAEAFALVRKSEIEASQFLQFITETLFSAPVYKTYGPIVAGDNFDHVAFKLPLGFKDNRLLLAAAEDAAVSMPIASLVHDRFVEAIALGLENSDWSAIARIAYRNAGLGQDPPPSRTPLRGESFGS